jgi:dTDP-4-amino-4,6-dideoxygalactose transaminase
MRDAMQAFLKERDVAALVHYPVPVHLQPAYRKRSEGCGPLPETERAAREVLSLPLYPELTEAQARTVAGLLRSFAGRIHD